LVQKRRIPEPFSTRLAAVRADLAARNLDGLLVQERMDQFWLTGFTGEDGQVLVTARQVVLLTDGRFDEAADSEAPWARKILRTQRGPEATAKQVRRCRLERVGYEPNHMNVATFTALRRAAKPTGLVSAAGVIGQRRMIKDVGEVAAICNAIAVAQKAYVKIARWIRPGLTERQIAAKLVFEMESLGAQGPAFRPIVAAGASASLPHYEPSDRKIRANQGVLIDWGARVGWYCSDLTRVIRVGSIPPRLAKVYDIVSSAHDAAIAVLGPNQKAAQADKAARDVISKAGFGDRFSHGLGHGLGLDVHEAPRLGKNSDDLLQPGMITTIEPGIYLPGYGGIRIESDVLITDNGYEVLSTLPY
jgi:Xaa-Pro aminopeptidase